MKNNQNNQDKEQTATDTKEFGIQDFLAEVCEVKSESVRMWFYRNNKDIKNMSHVRGYLKNKFAQEEPKQRNTNEVRRGSLLLDGIV